MLQAWKYPDWIYLVEKKLNCITLSTFPFPISIERTVIHPDKNKYLKEWAIRIDVTLRDITHRTTGDQTSLINPEGIYLYSEKDFEQIIYAEIERLVVHELKECFQIKEDHYSTKPALIPFDPHDPKSPRIKFAHYDRVDYCRFYPSYTRRLKESVKKCWQQAKVKCSLKFINWCRTIPTSSPWTASSKLIRIIYSSKQLSK